MPAIESTVTRTVEHPGNRYGIQIAGVWYNGFGKLPCAEGDEVHVQFEEVSKDGKTFYNVKNCTVLKKAAEKPKDVLSYGNGHAAENGNGRNGEINRAVALKAAVEWCICLEGVEKNADLILAYAKRFEKYLNGE